MSRFTRVSAINREGAVRALKFLAWAAATGCTLPACAKEEEKPHWSVTVTPRLQYLLFLPDAEADGLETLTSGGLTVTIRNPDKRFAVSATGLYGKGSGTFDFHNETRRGAFDYSGDRREISLLAEFTSPETGVTVLGGYHHFGAKADETLINGGADFEVNSYRFAIDAAEIGLRIGSRIGAGSRHAVTAQASMGVGVGHYKANEDRSIGGMRRTVVRDDTGIGYIGDVAFGYNYFINNRMTIGGRARGYVFYVQSKGSYPIFAVTPELNASYRF
jgi:hypothetical protein